MAANVQRIFSSDIIYKRYASSSRIDEETGNVYLQGTQGILAAFSADGSCSGNIP